MPEGPREGAMSNHFWVLPVDKGVSAMLLSVVESERFLEMSPCDNTVSQKIRVIAPTQMSFKQNLLVLVILGQMKQLFVDFPSCLQFSTHGIKGMETNQHGKDLRCLANSLTQFSRPRIGRFHFRRGKSLEGHQGDA